ncbi:hypothetical protein HMSSN139_42530 [Paenibacillus sp. HMSSN-139]|nr:hypothetical protein HMSSN139_42530 [Paenibacillus sp. HMSSN-139]
MELDLEQHKEQPDRYSRQRLFSPIGNAGQDKLEQAKVLVVGAGALGTGIAETLVRAGIGHLVIADRDYVEWSNLQRQQLFSEADAAERVPKAIAAKRRLAAINSQVRIDAHVMDVDPEELESLISGVNLIMDATDNFDTRLMINDISQNTEFPGFMADASAVTGLPIRFCPVLRLA